MTPIVIRDARAEDTDMLIDLAFQSEVSWGYSFQAMEARRAELTVSADLIRHWTIWVAQSEHAICGMIAFDWKVGDHAAELKAFFVTQKFRGLGVGAALMSALRSGCSARDVRSLGFDAEPLAAIIYHRFGFRAVGLCASTSVRCRMFLKL